MTLGRSFAIETTIRCDSKEQEGVLAAHGDLASSYTIYVKGNRLHY